jgi:hypothetical protein
VPRMLIALGVLVSVAAQTLGATQLRQVVDAIETAHQPSDRAMAGVTGTGWWAARLS